MGDLQTSADARGSVPLLTLPRALRPFSYWLEPYPPGDRLEQQRMLQLGLFSGLGAVASAGYSVAHLYLRAPVVGWTNVAVTAGMFAVPWWVRRQRSLEAGNQLFLFFATTMILIGITAKGGSRVPSFVWAMVPIVLAGLLGGLRTMWVYAGVVGVYILVTTVPTQIYPPPQIIPLEMVERFAAYDALTASMFVCAAVWAFLLTNQLAREQAEVALEQLAAENESRRVAEAEARQAAEAKSRFLAVMSHELRTPLNGIFGLTDILLHSDLHEEASGHIRKLSGAARSLRTLVDDILDISKLEAGKVVLEPQPVGLHALAEQVMELVHRGCPRDEVELRFEPQPPADLACAVDEVRLRQVLTNLLGNAVKFTASGWVRLGVSRVEDRLRFEVQDTGIGIPEDRVSALFRPFEQAEASTTRRFGGTGLGLAISQQLVHAMGGHIEVRSTPGEGSTFAFDIPYVAAELAATSLDLDALFDRSLPGEGPVLLVDDNDMNRLVALALFERLGIECETAEDGSSAIERVRQGGVRLVLMDIQMPGMDGFEATRRIREMEGERAHPRTPVVGYSANVLPEDRAAGAAAGMDDYLAKPAEPRALVETLTSVLDASV